MELKDGNAAELPPGVTFAEIDEAIDSLVEDGSIEKEDVKQVREMARDMVRKMRRKERRGRMSSLQCRYTFDFHTCRKKG